MERMRRRKQLCIACACFHPLCTISLYYMFCVRLVLSFTFDGTIQMEQIGLYWRLCIIIYVLWCHISASVIFFVMKSHLCACDVYVMIEDGMNTAYLCVHVNVHIYTTAHSHIFGESDVHIMNFHFIIEGKHVTWLPLYADVKCQQCLVLNEFQVYFNVLQIVIALSFRHLPISKSTLTLFCASSRVCLSFEISAECGCTIDRKLAFAINAGF